MEHVSAQTGGVTPPSVQLGSDRFLDPVLLASGGTADVYRGVDAELGRDVVIKVFRSSRSNDGRSDRDPRWAVLQSAAAIGHHPTITLPLSSGELDDGRPYLVYEFIPGGSLHDLITSVGALSRCDVLHLGVRLGGALAAIHRAGLVHGDVTPANVVMRDGTDPVLVDLASATPIGGQPLRSATRTFTAPEAISFTSPEPSIDVYGLGQTLLVAYRGFVDGGGAVTQDLDASEQAAFAVGIGSARARVIERTDPLLYLIDRCIRPHPSDRITVSELVEGLRDVQRDVGDDVSRTDGAVNPAGAVVRSPRSTTPAPDHTRLGAIALICLVASVVVAGLVVAGLSLTSLGDLESPAAEPTPVDATGSDCATAAAVQQALWKTSPTIAVRARDPEAFADQPIAAEPQTADLVDALTEAAGHWSDQAGIIVPATVTFTDYLDEALHGEPNSGAREFSTAMAFIDDVADGCDASSAGSWGDFDAFVRSLG